MFPKMVSHDLSCLRRDLQSSVDVHLPLLVVYVQVFTVCACGFALLRNTLLNRVSTVVRHILFQNDPEEDKLGLDGTVLYLIGHPDIHGFTHLLQISRLIK